MGTRSDHNTPERAKTISVGDSFFEGRFHIVEPTDTGDFSVAWVAHDSILHNQSTLKYLLDCTKLSNREIADFCEETKWQLFQHHPHIVKVFELQSHTTAADLIGKLITSKPSGENPNGGNPFFEVQHIEDLIELLCESLLRIHLPSIAETNDSNSADGVFLREDNRSEFAFEVSKKVTHTITRLTGVRSIFTTAYGSPEQGLGKPLDEKQDVYAVGALIYDLLTGRPPFFQGDVLCQIQQITPPSMSERRRELGCKGGLITQRWEDAVSACLAKDPAARPDFAQLISHLFKETGPVSGKKSFRVSKLGILALTGFCLAGISINGAKRWPEKFNYSTEVNSLAVDQPVFPELPALNLPKPSLTISSALPTLKTVVSKYVSLPKPPELEIPNDIEDTDPVRAERIFASIIAPEPEPLSLEPAFLPADPVPVAIPEAIEEPNNKPEPKTEKGDPFVLESINMKMIWVHPLKSWISWSEVTRKQFSYAGGKVRSRFSGEDRPVDSVSWYQAMEFCEKLTAQERSAGRLPVGYEYSLPTEKQWKLFVGDADLNHAYHGQSGSTGPTAPGSLPENNYGLVDVRGNLWEWTLDDFDTKNPAKGKALRGGSYVTKGYMIMDEFARFYGKKDVSYHQYGFRFVLTPEKPEG